MMKRKCVCFFLVMLLCIGLLLITASAANTVVASGTCGTDLRWSLDSGGTLTISGTGSMKDYSNNLSAIPWTSWEDEFTDLVIEAGVTGITKYAFADSTALKRISFPETITSWGVYAFAHCTALETVVLPENMGTLPEAMFYECSNLASVTLPSRLSKIGANAFYKCAALKTISFPNTLSSIGEDAFVAAGLTSVVLPDSVTELAGDHVFSACKSLTDVTLGKGLKIIPESTFGDCSSLKAMVIPANVYQVDMYAFRRSGLETLVFLNGNCRIYVPVRTGPISDTIPTDTILHSFSGAGGVSNHYSYSVASYAGQTGTTFHLLQAATCSSAAKCTVEGCGVTGGEKLPHTPSAAVQENVVAATCKEAGSYEEVITCAVCTEEISRTKMTIEKLATHTPAEAVRENQVAASCTKPAGYEAVVYCGICGIECSRETKTEGEPLGHSLGAWETVTEADYLQDGLQHRSCSRCGHKEEQILPATGPAVAAGIEIDRDGATIRLLQVPEDLVIVAAAYCGDQMTAACVSQPTAGERTLSLPETASQDAVWIFILNTEFQPIAPARKAVT